MTKGKIGEDGEIIYDEVIEKKRDRWFALLGIVIGAVATIVAAIIASNSGVNLSQIFNFSGNSMVATATSDTSLYPTQAAISQTTKVAQLQTPVTPLVTQPLRNQIPLPFTDGFNDPAYDGAFNPNLWSGSFNGSCEYAQWDGMLIAGSTQDNVICTLIASNPQLVTFDDLGTMQARIKLASDHQGGTIAQGIGFDTEITEGGWRTTCGLEAIEDRQIHVIFDVYVSGKVDIRQSIPVEYDTWYTVSLEADVQNGEIRCFIDDTLINSIVPSDIAELREASFKRTLEAWRTVGSTATTYVDYAEITP